MRMMVGAALLLWRVCGAGDGGCCMSPKIPAPGPRRLLSYTMRELANMVGALSLVHALALCLVVRN